MFLPLEAIESRSNISATIVHDAVFQFWAGIFDIPEDTPIDQLREAIISRISDALSRKRKATASEIAVADTPVLQSLACEGRAAAELRYRCFSRTNLISRS